jgi:hypothetical protein
MPESLSTISIDTVNSLKLREIDLLPYGLFEVTTEGEIVDYIPFRSQITVHELPSVRGQNLFHDFLHGETFAELHSMLPALAASADCRKNWLLVLPFTERTVRLSVVASVNQNSPRIRISLARLSGAPAFEKTSRANASTQTRPFLNQTYI